MVTTPITVIHIVREAEGGMRKHVLTLLKHTDKLRFRLGLVASKRFLDSVQDQIPEEVKRLEVEIGDSIGFSGLMSLPVMARFVRSSSHPRIIHAHGYTAALVGGAV